MTLPSIAYSGGTYHWIYLPITPSYSGELVGTALARVSPTYGGAIAAGIWSPLSGSPYLLPTWATISGYHTDPIQETLAANAPTIVVGMNDTPLPFSNSNRTVVTDPSMPDPRAFTYSTVMVGPRAVLSGATSETGTVTVFQYDWVTTILGYNDVSFGAIPQVYQYYTQTHTTSQLVVYMPVSFDVAAGGGPPSPITLQIKQNQDGSYTPQTPGVLVKYDGTSVRQIRAHFGSARVAVIKPAINGGFLLYEEITNVPSGTVYVYSNTRTFVIAVPAAQIGQYLA